MLTDQSERPFHFLSSPKASKKSRPSLSFKYKRSKFLTNARNDANALNGNLIKDLDKSKKSLRGTKSIDFEEDEESAKVFNTNELLLPKAGKKARTNSHSLASSEVRQQNQNQKGYQVSSPHQNHQVADESPSAGANQQNRGDALNQNDAT